MAWIVGQANKAEIKMLEDAGFEVFGTSQTGEKSFKEVLKDLLKWKPEDDDHDIMIATFVDCDIPDLLDFSEGQGTLTSIKDAK